jgi:hypothetical protein
VREVLARKGIPLLTTADHGELAIEFQADGLMDVRPARPAALPPILHPLAKSAEMP